MSFTPKQLEFFSQAEVQIQTSKEERFIPLMDIPKIPGFSIGGSAKEVVNAAARLALSLEAAQGFAVVDADTGKSWMLVDGGTPSISGDWLQLGDRDITAADITDAGSAFPALAQAETVADQRRVLGLGQIILTKADNSVTLYTPAADTDAARGDSLSTAWAAATAGSRLDVGPGNYLMHRTTNYLADNVTYQFHNSYLYIDNTSTSAVGGGLEHWLFYSRTAAQGGLAHNWKFLGPVTIDGVNQSGKSAIVVQNGNNRVIRDVWFKRWPSYGLWMYGGWSSTEGWGNRIESCMAEYCGIGFETVGAEYLHWTNCVARNNTTGFSIACGNNYLVNCVAAYNTNGVYISPGSNPGHGSWVGGGINHNTSIGVKSFASMSMGFQFVGTHIYTNGTTGIQLLGDNMNFIGCGIDSVITPSATAGVKNYFINCFFPFANETNAEYDTAIAGWTTAQRANIKFLRCTTETGNFSHNDLLKNVYADNAAAVTGGLIAGDEYRTSTGAVMVVTP